MDFTWVLGAMGQNQEEVISLSLAWEDINKSILSYFPESESQQLKSR